MCLPKSKMMNNPTVLFPGAKREVVICQPRTISLLLRFPSPLSGFLSVYMPPPASPALALPATTKTPTPSYTSTPRARGHREFRHLPPLWGEPFIPKPRASDFARSQQFLRRGRASANISSFARKEPPFVLRGPRGGRAMAAAWARAKRAIATGLCVSVPARQRAIDDAFSPVAAEEEEEEAPSEVSVDKLESAASVSVRRLTSFGSRSSQQVGISSLFFFLPCSFSIHLACRIVCGDVQEKCLLWRWISFGFGRIAV